MVETDPRIVELMDDYFRLRVCLHEAGHAEYMEQIGDTYVEFIPMRGSDCYATVTNNATQDLAQMKANLKGYIKAGAAAEIVEGVLTGCTSGTEGDKEQIKAVFDALGTPDKERKRILKQARKEILNDLNNPAFRKALWARARFFQHLLEHHLNERILECHIHNRIRLAVAHTVPGTGVGF